MPAVASSRYGDRSPAHRATSIGLTIAAHLLLAWLLLHLGTSLTRRDDAPPLSTFDVSPPGPAPQAAPAPRAAAERRRAAASPARAAAPVVRPPAPSPTSAPAAPTAPAMLALDYDLGKAPRRSDGDEEAAGSSRGDSVVAYGPGAGPGGERLYNADWAREPRPAELNGYLPNGVSSGSWALIACRTIPGNQVENCRSLGESPPGSGLARAMREAAWQFRILPPRLGGKPIIGAWVRIRFDWTAGGMETR